MITITDVDHEKRELRGVVDILEAARPNLDRRGFLEVLATGDDDALLDWCEARATNALSQKVFEFRYAKRMKAGPAELALGRAALVRAMAAKLTERRG